MEIYRTLKEYPVFAKVGTIVPLMVHQSQDNRLIKAKEMEEVVFPGAGNVFTLYEDEVDYNRFEQGAFEQTTMELLWGERAVLSSNPQLEICH